MSERTRATLRGVCVCGWMGLSVGKSGKRCRRAVGSGHGGCRWSVEQGGEALTLAGALGVDASVRRGTANGTAIDLPLGLLVSSSTKCTRWSRSGANASTSSIRLICCAIQGRYIRSLYGGLFLNDAIVD